MYATAKTAATVAATTAPIGFASPLPLMPAPYMRRRNAPARSMLAACVAAGYSVAATQAWLNRQGRNALLGLPVSWPR